MVTNKLVLGIAIVIASLILLGTTLPASSVGLTYTVRVSRMWRTDQRDNMVGDDNSNAMFAFGDNDVLTGKGLAML